MSPFNAIRSTSDFVQMAAMIGSVALGAFGIGVNIGKEPDLEPQVKANTVAIDSLRAQSTQIARDLAELAKNTKTSTCILSLQVTADDPIKCLP